VLIGIRVKLENEIRGLLRTLRRNLRQGVDWGNEFHPFAGRVQQSRAEVRSITWHFSRTATELAPITIV
jgi:hypothetical protein